MLSKEGQGELAKQPAYVEEGLGANPTRLDPWAHRSSGMRCRTCMWFVEKASHPSHLNTRVGRCRRHAPTMTGYPVVFSDDWCGDHKLNEGAL